MKTLFNNLRWAKSGRIGVSQFALWRLDVKVQKAWVGPLISMGRLVLGSLNRSWVIQIHEFSKSCVHLARKNGVKGLVMYLKTAHVCLMQSLPGSVLRHNSREIGKVAVARCRDGLPRIIPRGSRRLIRKGHVGCIRLWMTLLSVYRILPCKGKLKIETIVKPGVEFSDAYLLGFRSFVVKHFIPKLEEFTGETLRDLDPEDVLKIEPLGITHASADSPFNRRATDGFRVTDKLSSFGVRKHSAARWIKGFWGNSLEEYLWFLGQAGDKTNTLWAYMEDAAQFSRDERRNIPNGRLSTKEEPAGKVRVFAMVDYWTQVALYPLHSYLMNVCKDIPSDGTFDQLKPVRRMLKKVTDDQIIYSFDLSAATDRLPVVLQEVLLGVVFTPDFAAAWKELLVGRRYHLPKGVSYNGALQVMYAVGQPMGAYSSWAMLAWTHHAIVQWAARRTGFRGNWFEAYAVLGDDIVIADDAVAKMYQVICAEIGLEIGLAKSLASRGKTCEFAKTLFFRGQNVSGLPMNLWNAARTSTGVMVAMLARLDEQVGLSFASIATSIGVGFKNATKLGNAWKRIPRKLQVLGVVLTHPGVKTTLSRKNWLEWLVQEGPLLPVKAPESLHWFQPWATALINEVVRPAEEVVMEKASHLYFGEQPRDVWARLYEIRVNNHIVKAQNSLELAEKSMAHLQRLNVKFMMHQAGAVLQQVTAVAERWAQVPELAARVEKHGVVKVRAISPLPIWSKWNQIRTLSRVECIGPSAAEMMRERLSPGEDRGASDCKATSLRNDQGA
nr:MAG: putative RNA-dependent RNA polymerase [Mitoviridae sp.]